MVEYLFESLDQIRKQIGRADLILLFLDYDGTLVPFEDKPEDATPSEDLIKIIKDLVKNPKFLVSIVSGRTIQDLKRMLSIEGLSFAGVHGLSISYPNKEYIWKDAVKVRPILDKIKEKTIDDLGNEEGIYLEDKEFTLALHYRLLPRERVTEVKEKFIGIVRYYDSPLEVLHGSEVLEVRPEGWHKGKAVEVMIDEYFNRYKNKEMIPIYIGDDTTDEDAFNTLENGVTVLVSNKTKRETRARFYVRNQKEVLSFLKWILESKFA